MQTAFQVDAFQNDAFQISALHGTTGGGALGATHWKPLKLDFLNLDEIRDMDDEDALIMFAMMEMM
jgi:hypothetical protein